MSPARNIAHSKPSEIDWKYGEPIAESPSRNTGVVGERVVAGSRGVPRTAGRVAGPVEVERDADDLEVADELAVRLLLDLVDEAIHRLGDDGKVVAEPIAVELLRHRLVLVGA